MQIDWDKPIEIKVWKEFRSTNGWVDAWLDDFGKGFIETSVHYIAEDGKEYSFGALTENGIIQAGYDGVSTPPNPEKWGKVRNKKEILNAPDNRAVFYFERQGDVYILTGWKNVLGSKEIASKYGEVVNQKYLYTDGEYFHLECGHLWIRDSQRDNAYFTLGEKMTKHQFEKFIKVLKSAGERLSKLVRDSKKPEKIEVVI